MTTVDQLLLKFFNKGIDRFDKAVPPRDKKILSSLSRQIISGHFLTENQAKLLLKIFKENEQYLKDEDSEFTWILENPTWGQPYRVIEQVRTITLSKEYDTSLIVEFTHSKRLKDLFSNLLKTIQGQPVSISSRQYAIPLTEQNVYSVVKTFKDYHFSIDESVMRFYEEISEILKDNESKFEIFSTENSKMKNKIFDEIGEISKDNILLLNDRRLRYQYLISDKISEKSLTSTIAQRNSTKIHLNKFNYNLTDVVKSLIELHRLPMLVVLDGHSSKEDLATLVNLQKSLVENSILDQIGIYYRFDNNTPNNKNFNLAVGGMQYNSPLDLTTKVAGISNGKLPKFMIKSDWYPKSVISFTNNFRNNKTVTYCDAVDLVIYYTDRQPIIEKVDAIL